MMFKYMCLVLFITWYQLADCHPAKTSDLKSMDSLIDKESEAYLAVDAGESSQKTTREKRTVGFLRQLFPGISQSAVSDNTVVKRTARDVSEEEAKISSQIKRSPLTDSDADVSSSSDNGLSDASPDGADDAEKAETNDDPRNKRFLLNLGAGGSGGGGSGNFVFDLIRLIAGSGTTPQEKDDSANASLENAQEVRADVNTKEDGYSVGVPGPLTRIFVIANRGVANLVQDLILRLAQTTERIVNFKARLITSLI